MEAAGVSRGMPPAPAGVDLLALGRSCGYAGSREVAVPTPAHDTDGCRRRGDVQETPSPTTAESLTAPWGWPPDTLVKAVYRVTVDG